MPALPAQPGPLIGRATELALVGSRLGQADARLLTLTGPAGTGKTRLAVEIASHTAERFPGGTFFIDLAPVFDPAMVSTAVARALGIREPGDRPLVDLLKEHLASSEALLLLDNFEQVLPAAPQFSDVLQSCPGLKLLVTSRSALRLRWEHVIPVAPLAVPDLSTLLDLDRLGEVAAVDLFVQRAQRVDPHFRLTAANASVVASICVRLDGLPLALELAAARCRVLPPQALLSRLEHRLDVLATTAADQPARQRTLRAALDWSYELLSADEQAIFRRLGVFVGGFPLNAVAEVCDPDGGLRLDPLNAIEALVDNSLIRQERVTASYAEPRFVMLETMREYALERLQERGETELTRHRHARYYLLGADVPVAEMKMSQETVWLQMLDAEHDNVRTALAWCEEGHEPELGLSAASLLAWFWTVRGHVTEGRRRLSALLDLATQAPPALRAEAMRVLGSLALHQSDYVAARLVFEQCLAIRRGLGDPAGLLSPLTGLAAVAMQMGELDKARAYFEDALAIQTQIEDKIGIAESLNNLANIAHEAGDLAQARELYERSLKFQQVEAIRYRPDVPSHNLGVVALAQGDLASARKHLEDSVAVRRALGDRTGLALSLAKLGEVLSASGDAAAAHRLLRESLMLQRELGDRAGMAFVLERLAMVASARGEPAHALRLAAAADSLRQAIGSPLAPGARSGYDQWLGSVRDTLGPDEVAVIWESTAHMTLDQVLTEAGQIESSDPAPTPKSTTLLSIREREVAALLAEGLSNRDIAERLVVSERTAENHVQHVLNRLGLRSRAQVAAWAVRNGLTS